MNKEIDFKAQRFAEGGSKDLGDIQLFVKDEEYCLFLALRTLPNIKTVRNLVEPRNWF